MHRLRVAVSAVATAALVPLTASAALADPPSNDTPDGAIALKLGQTYDEDTTQATTDKQDTQLNQYCGAPHTNGSVWFTYTPKGNGYFVVDTSQSDYSTGLMLFAGPPTPDGLLDCGPVQLADKGQAGTTYYIMAFSPTKKTGGNLSISIEQPPPPPTISMTLHSTGRAYSDGTARLFGTYTCTDADWIEIDGMLTQVWKRVKITGYFTVYREGTCDGTLHHWIQRVTSDNGLYARGYATADLVGYDCGTVQCAQTKLKDAPVHLRKGGPPPQTTPPSGHVSPLLHACLAREGLGSAAGTASKSVLHPTRWQCAMARR